MNINAIKFPALLALCILSPGCAWGGNPIKLDLKLNKSEFILGEAIYGRLTIINTSSQNLRLPPNMPHDPLYDIQVSGNIDKACIPPAPQYTEAISEGWVLNAGQSKVVLLRLDADYGVVNPGVYSMIVKLDSSRYPRGLLKMKPDQVTATSDRLSFTVTNPVGIDAAAFEKNRNRCNRVIENISLAYEFPESLYAGHILLEEQQDVVQPLGFKKEIKGSEQTINAYIHRNHEGLESFQKEKLPLGDDPKSKKTREAMKKMTDATERFVATHPESPYSGYLLAKGGSNALAVGDFPRACAMLKKSIGLNWILPEGFNPENELLEFRSATINMIRKLDDEGVCEKTPHTP